MCRLRGAFWEMGGGVVCWNGNECGGGLKKRPPPGPGAFGVVRFSKNGGDEKKIFLCKTLKKRHLHSCRKEKRKLFVALNSFSDTLGIVRNAWCESNANLVEKKPMKDTLKALTKGTRIKALFNKVENGQFRSLEGTLEDCKECKDGSLQVILAIDGKGYRSFKADNHLRTLTVEDERI